MTPKVKRKWIKDEKRIVRLLYRKGLLKNFKIDDLYWEEYNRLNRHYKSKPNKYDGKIYRFNIYMPEIHFATHDYWGETDEHSVVSYVLEHLYWSNVDTDNWDKVGDLWPKSTFPKMNRQQFINYLRRLPTLVNDNKINKILKRRIYY